MTAFTAHDDEFHNLLLEGEKQMSEDERRERTVAPDEIINVGYFLKEAREALRQGTEGYGGNYVARAFWYLTEAVERRKDALEKFREYPGWNEFLPGDALVDILEACNMLADYIGSPQNPMTELLIESKIGKGHGKLSENLVRKMRFKVITNADFERVQKKYNHPGGGGGR